jgi:SPW repeat
MAIRSPRERGSQTRRARRGWDHAPMSERDRTPAGFYDPAVPEGGAPAPLPPRGDWREEIVSLSGLNVLAGIWLIIAPWVLGYSQSDPRWNDVVFGIIVGVLALIRVSGAYRADWLSWINALIGIWLIVAAFTIDQSSVAAWNDIILGIIVFLLAVGSAEATASVWPWRSTRTNEPTRTSEPPIR